MKQKPKISQAQIAADLGISQTLVSMVLNGRRKGVAPETFRQIWEHARKIGYRAKGMAAQHSHAMGPVTTAGFILRANLQLNSQRPFFAHVQDGLHEYLASQGVALAFLGCEAHLEFDRLHELYVQRGGFQGLVILGEVAHSFLHALQQVEPRFVLVAARYPGLCYSIVYNEEQAAEQIVEHLTELGHSKFAWLGGSTKSQRARKRQEATEAALRLRNISIDPEFILNEEEGNSADGRTAAERILAAAGKKKPPTAWICYNGSMARGAANFLLQNGMRIPEDVSLAAFDRTRECTDDSPTLTGAGADPEEMGKLAGQLLLRNSESPPGTFSDNVLASVIIERESSGPVGGRRTK